MPLNKKENERLSFLIVFIHVYSHSYFSCFFPLYDVNIFFIFLFVAVKSNIFRFLLICRLYLTLFIFSFLFLGNHASPVLISSWSIAFVFSVFFSVCIYLFLFNSYTHVCILFSWNNTGSNEGVLYLFTQEIINSLSGS